MFESLVAIAAVTGRELVIPGRTTIEHMAHEKFHEFDVYSKEALKKVINISELSPEVDYREADRPEEAKQAAILTKHLNEHDVLQDLPADRDWCFLAKDARITHFECLQQLLQCSTGFRLRTTGSRRQRRPWRHLVYRLDNTWLFTSAGQILSKPILM